MSVPALHQRKPTANVVRGMEEQAKTYSQQRGFYRSYGKRFFDLFMVVLIAPTVIPVMVLVSLLLLVLGMRPFYSQERLGQGGRPFRIWKFQTMLPDADKLLERVLASDATLRAEWESTQKLKNDPRITLVGHYLRKTSIDELPQLWNVIKGDMSLLGPRPMMLDQQYLYGPALPVYTSLRPGISGMWQVSERNESHFQRRAELDIDYARNLSFATDLRLVGKTFRTLLYSTGY